MKRLGWGAAALVLIGALVPVFGGAFVPVGEVAPVADLDAEARAQFKTLEGLLKDEAMYNAGDNKKKKVPRAAGVIAVMGQAIAEHPDKAKVKVSGPHLRDAARKVVTSKSYDDAVAGLKDVRSVLAGESSGTAEVDHAWNKLMSLHRLMEEVEDRQVELRKTFVVANKGGELKPGEGSVHASALAVLALVVYADTHEVKKQDEIPEWQKLAAEFRLQLTTLSKALHKGDAATMKTTFPKIGQSCVNCHDQFRN